MLTPQGFTAIETAFWLVTSFGGVLLYGRVVRFGSTAELALMTAMVLLAIGDFAFVLVPAVANRTVPSLTAWAAESSRLVAAAGLAIAALGPARALARPRAAARWGLAAAHGIVLVIALLALVGGPYLPSVPGPSTLPDSADPRIAASGGLVGLQLAIGALYAASALGCLRRHAATGDPLLAWLPAAMLLSAVARVDFLLLALAHPEWAFTGDFFRVGSALALLAGVVLEVRANREQLAADAVHRERRRLARDLHDSLMQDLALIRSLSERLAGAGVDPARVAGIAEAAQRALDESRSTITVLSRPADEPIGATLVGVAAELAALGQAAVAVDVQPDLAVAPPVREALIRIVREALGNAIRHGGAGNVLVHAREQDGLLLRIVDDGAGFDLGAAARPGSFGLTSMRERAAALGGRLEMTSALGVGTTVLVQIP